MVGGSLLIEDNLNPILKSQYVLKGKSASQINVPTYYDSVQTSKLLLFSVDYIEKLNDNESEFNNYNLTHNVSINESIINRKIKSAASDVAQEEEPDFQSSVILLPSARINSQPMSVVLNESMVPDQIINLNKSSCENDKGNINFTVSQVIIHSSPSSPNLAMPDDTDQKSPVASQKLILMSCADNYSKENIFQQLYPEQSKYQVKNNIDHYARIADDQNISITNNNNNSNYSDDSNEMENRSLIQFSIPSNSPESNALDEIITLSEISEEHNKILLDDINYSIKNDKNDKIGGDDISEIHIHSLPSQQHQIFLSNASQNDEMLIKPAEEVFANVEAYTLDRSAYSPTDVGSCYPEVGIGNVMKSVENEFLITDAVEFDETDNNILEPGSKEPENIGRCATSNKTRSIESEEENSAVVDFDFVENSCEMGTKYSRHDMRIVSNKSVASRARATLPKDLLAIKILRENTNEEGVFARKPILGRVQFGPVEGRLMKRWNKNVGGENDELELLLEVETGHLLKIDVSNEHESNWMRFVRRAKTLKEQNLMLTQQGKSLYYISTRVIPPRQELKVGYSPQYAQRRKLTTLNNSSSWNHFESESILNPTNLAPEEKTCKKSNVSSLKPLPVFREIKAATGIPKSEMKKENECRSCHKVFPRSYSLKRHLLAVHSQKDKENSTFAADPDQESSISNTLFKKKPSMGPKSEWLCTHCNLTFDNSSVLNLHTLTHAAEDLESESGTGPSSVLTSGRDKGESLIDPGRIQCPQCTREFFTKRELIDHVSAHGKITLKRLCGNSTNAYKCDRCYKSFATDMRLKRHMFVHGSEDIKPFQCSTCLKRFLNNSALSCHVKTHSETKFFDCPMCKKEFKHVFALKEHIKIHSKGGRFTCPHCSKVFDGYSVVRKHIRAFHSGHEYKCEVCGKLCLTLDKLRMHSLKHSDHREFLCANCGKQFKRKDKLKEHMKRMHTADREIKPTSLKISNAKEKGFTPKMCPATFDRFIYKCRICMVGFKRRGMLVNHLAKRHPDVVPDTVPELNLPILKITTDYFCQYCDKIYKSSSKRKAHILKNHPGAELPMSKKGIRGQVVGAANSTFSQTVGSVKTSPHGCEWCHKQYASKAKLLQHQRKKHATLLPQSQQVPRAIKNSNSSKCDQILGINGIDSSSGSTLKQSVLSDKVKTNEAFASSSNPENIFQEEYDVNGDFIQVIGGTPSNKMSEKFKAPQENVTYGLLQEEIMEELGRTLPHENLLEIGAAKHQMNGEERRHENRASTCEPAVAWANLPPCPPR